MYRRCAIALLSVLVINSYAMSDGIKNFFSKVQHLGAKIGRGEKVSLADIIPAEIQLPETLNKDLSSIVIHVPTIQKINNNMVVMGKILSSALLKNGDDELLTVRFESIDNYPDEFYLSMSLQSAKTEKLSDVLKRIDPRIATAPNEIDIALIRPALVISFGDYKAIESPDLGIVGKSLWPNDKEKGKQVSIAYGINIISQVKLLGVAEQFTSLLGEGLNSALLVGVITPTLVGSSFSVSLGHINIVPTVKGLLAGGWTLRVALGGEQDNFMPLIGLSTDSIKLTQEFFSTYVPDLGVSLTEPIKASSSVTLKPTGMNMSLVLSGKSILPLSSLSAFLPSIEAGGDLGIELPIDFGLLAAAVPFSGLGVRWSMQFGSRKIAFAGKVEISSGSIGSLVLDGQLKGRYSLKEFIEFVATFVRSSSNGAVDLIAIADSVVPGAYNNVADFAVEDLRLSLIPKDTSIAGKPYYRGFLSQGKAEMFGIKGELKNVINITGLKSFGTLSPIYIKDANGNPVISLTSASSATDGALVDLSIMLPPNLYYKLDGLLTLHILGGIAAKTNINISPTMLTADIHHTFGSIYQTLIRVSSDLSNSADLKNTSADNFLVYIKMEQSALQELQKTITDFSRGLVRNFDEKSQAEFDRVEAEIRRLEEERDKEYAICMGPGWDWSHARCRLFWGEIVSRQAKIDGLVVYRDGILKPGTVIARGVLSASADINEFTTSLLARGFNIEKFECSAKLAEYVTQGMLPNVSMRVHFLGRTLDIENLQFSFGDIPGSAKRIVEKLYNAWHY